MNSLGFKKPSKPEISVLVQDLLAHTAESEENASSTYSLYSSIAHAQIAGINIFVAHSSRTAPTSLTTPLPFVTHMAAQLLRAVKTTCSEFAVWQRGSDTDLSRIDDAGYRAAKAISALPDVAFATFKVS